MKYNKGKIPNKWREIKLRNWKTKPYHFEALCI
jgi:hypothetical protein